jgi:hypothetical protein
MFLTFFPEQSGRLSRLCSARTDLFSLVLPMGKIFPGADPATFESPHLEWLQSDAVVGPILNDSYFNSINPCHNDQIAYPYFRTSETFAGRTKAFA